MSDTQQESVQEPESEQSPIIEKTNALTTRFIDKWFSLSILLFIMFIIFTILDVKWYEALFSSFLFIGAVLQENISNVLFKQGKLAEAMELYQQVLRVL